MIWILQCHSLVVIKQSICQPPAKWAELMLIAFYWFLTKGGIEQAGILRSGISQYNMKKITDITSHMV